MPGPTLSNRSMGRGTLLLNDQPLQIQIQILMQILMQILSNTNMNYRYKYVLYICRKIMKQSRFESRLSNSEAAAKSHYFPILVKGKNVFLAGFQFTIFPQNHLPYVLRLCASQQLLGCYERILWSTLVAKIFYYRVFANLSYPFPILDQDSWSKASMSSLPWRLDTSFPVLKCCKDLTQIIIFAYVGSRLIVYSTLVAKTSHPPTRLPASILSEQNQTLHIGLSE